MPDHASNERLELVRLLTRNQSFILAYAYAIVRDHHLVEDVYQEVAAVLAADWDDLPVGEGLHPWLKQVVRRKSLEIGRKARRHILLSPEALASVAGAFGEQAVQDTALRTAMAQCVEKLGGDARQVVESRYRDCLSCETIAGRIGRSVQSVYAILKRARVALAACVRDAHPSFDGGGDA